MNSMTLLSAQERDRLRRRSHATSAVRAFFSARDFLEVDTPVAIAAPAPEPYIDAVPLSLSLGSDDPVRRFLQTSPELAMKRLVAQGMGPIFQIAPCFRDDDCTPWHRPEFRLLEWYRPTTRYLDLIDDAMALLRYVLMSLGRPPLLQVGERVIRLDEPPEVEAVGAVVLRHTGLDLQRLGTADALRDAMRGANMRTDPTDSWSDLFHRLFFTAVEPHLSQSLRPVFLTEFPEPLAALARLHPLRPNVSERVELYVGGIELANGFGELTDAAEQRRRFVRDNTERARLGRTVYPLDESFLREVGHMPPNAGMALGLERLLMLIEGIGDIDEVSYIPWL